MQSCHRSDMSIVVIKAADKGGQLVLLSLGLA